MIWQNMSVIMKKYLSLLANGLVLFLVFGVSVIFLAVGVVFVFLLAIPIKLGIFNNLLGVPAPKHGV